MPGHINQVVYCLMEGLGEQQGVRQITHLDNYCDKLTYWLCGVMPKGRFSIEPGDYGISLFVA